MAPGPTLGKVAALTVWKCSRPSPGGADTLMERLDTPTSPPFHPVERNTITTNDQLTFQDPVERFPEITPPKQDQSEPGLDAELVPQTDRGEHSHRGTGRLEDRRALITGADSGIGAAVAIAFAREGADVALSYLPVEEDEQPSAVSSRRPVARHCGCPGTGTSPTPSTARVWSRRLWPGWAASTRWSTTPVARSRSSASSASRISTTTRGHHLRRQHPIDLSGLQGRAAIPATWVDHRELDLNPGLQPLASPLGLRLD